MPHSAPDVSVVIVNWGTRQLLHDCLASVYEDLDRSARWGEVLVVDNGSTDGSAEMVAGVFPRTRLIRNDENRSYAAGNNQGILQTTGRYVLLLNSDAMLMRGAIDVMASRLDANPHLAGVSPKFLNPDGTIQRSCWPFPLKAVLANTCSLYRLGILDDYRKWDHRADRVVDWVSSACVMIPRAVFDRVGLLDEQFFYGVDVDWAFRAAKAGYRCLSVSDAAVIHIGKGSQRGGGEYDLPVGPAGDSQFFRKHYGPLGVAFFRVLLVGGGLPRLLWWEVAHLCRFGGEADRRRLVFRRLLLLALGFRMGNQARG